MSDPVAAVDCGTNTVRLLIGTLPEVSVRESRVVRLGEGVDATGVLGTAALQRTFAALEDYAALIRAHGVARVRVCATSATRDASNASVFVEGVVARLGVAPDVLTGEEEALLSFQGTLRHLSEPAPRPVLVVDVGGGSTEVVLGDSVLGGSVQGGSVVGDSEPAAGASMDMGSVRLTERHLRSDPPTSAELAACTRDIDGWLDPCPVDLSAARTVVGVAGTALTVAAAVLDLPSLDVHLLDQARLPAYDIRAVTERLASMTLAERRALPFMDPGRADVIVAGALILSRVLARTAVTELVVSVADLLDGIAWSIADPHSRWGRMGGRERAAPPGDRATVPEPGAAGHGMAGRPGGRDDPGRRDA